MARTAIPGRKDTILNAALELFAKKGYAPSSMADIAQKAKVAVGTVYLYFDNKEQVLKACAERFHSEHHTEVQRLLATPIPAPEKLQKYILERHRKWQQETAGSKRGTDLAQAMLQISPKTTRKERRLWTSTLTQIATQGVRDGLFHFESREKELKIFYLNLAAYFPLPGSSYTMKPSEKDLVQMLQWFCRKWSVQ